MATNTALSATGASTGPNALGAAAGVFMQHDRVPTLTSPLLRRLCETWTTRNASPAASATVRRWGQTHPALDGLRSPGDIVDRIASSDPPAKDQILRVLLALVQHGERLAGEILIHTMLPVLTVMPRTIRSPRAEQDYEETLHRVLAEFWEVITQPRQLTRPGVAGRLRMDTLHRVTTHRRTCDVWEDHVTYIGWDEQLDDQVLRSNPTPTAPAGGLARNGTDPAHRDLNPDGDLAGVLLWMRDAGELSRGDAQFLAEVYLVSGGCQRAAAERLGLSYVATRQRVSRLRNRLCAAAAEVSGRRTLASAS